MLPKKDDIRRKTRRLCLRPEANRRELHAGSEVCLYVKRFNEHYSSYLPEAGTPDHFEVAKGGAAFAQCDVRKRGTD